MHEKSPVLNAELRERTGSRYAKRAREAGQLPAVVYGHKQDPVAISVDHKEALTHFKKGEKVFSLELGGKTEHVLLKDLGYDHLGTNIVHADFARVDLNERVHTRAHVKLVGDAVGLKKAGAVMMHPVSELELECTVTNLPDSIEVNVSDLDVGESIFVGDVKLPMDTMKLLSDPKGIVAHIVAHGGGMETSEEGEVSTDSSQPEVIGEKKDEDGSSD